MKRIHIIVSASEMPAVREAAFIAGADKLVATRIPHRTAIGELGDGYSKTSVSAREDHTRMEITSHDGRFDGVISAVLSIAHGAKIASIGRPERIKS